MHLRTQLRIAALIPAVITLLIGGVFWIAESVVHKAQQAEEIAAKLRVANFELNILTQEYLLFGSSRIESQVRIRLGTMGDLLAQLIHEDETEDERELVQTLRRSYQELGGFYELLFGNVAASKEQIAGALLVKAQSIRAKSEMFSNIQQAQALQAQGRAVSVVAISLLAMAVLSVVILILLTRKLISGIRHLEEGVRRVAEGDREYQIPLDSSTEFGRLALSFNEMNRRLRESYASIEALLAGSRQLNANLELQQTVLEERNVALRREMEMRRHQEELIQASNATLTRQKSELEAALDRVKRLEGFISICMECKKIRTEGNVWQQLEQYIGEHSDAIFSHGLCPDCMNKAMKNLD